MLNSRFGKLTVLKFIGNAPKSKRTLWLCKCDCGNEKVLRSDCLRSGATKSCGCSNKITGKENRNWKGYGDISGRYWSKIIGEARKRDLKFEIDIEDAWNLFLKQERKCALSDLEISFKISKRDKLQTASLDRIDSDKDYTLDNIQWLHKRVNIMKMDLKETEFIDFCSKILRHYHKTNESDCQSEQNGGIPL